MMRISGIHSGLSSNASHDKRSALAPIPASQALIPVPNDAESARQAAPQRATAKPGYAAAPFLAHLIATAEHLPQTRLRRRAAPAEACAAYTQTQAARPLAVFS